MDAKTLKAAVTAALRVTVSTSLIGCGAHTSTDAAGGRPPNDTRDPAASRPDDPERAEGGGKPSTESGYPTASAGVASSNSASGGSASGGGASEGGDMMASAAGEGGAGTQPLTQCETAAACLGTLEAMTFEHDEPLTSGAAACCQLVVESLSWVGETAVCDPETRSALNARFMRAPARGACCRDPDTWQQEACTPWGPPVPPELPPEVMSDWELVA